MNRPTRNNLSVNQTDRVLFSRRPIFGRLLALASVLTVAATLHGANREHHCPPPAIDNIDHIIVIYQENWSFDSLYGAFPGADGIRQASRRSLDQLDKLTGKALSSELGLGKYNNQSNTIVVNNPPAPINSAGDALDPTFLNPDGSTKIYTLIPYLLTNPKLGLGINPSYITGDIYHRYWQEQSQINGGKDNLFVSWSDNPGLVMSWFNATYLPEGFFAQQYTICDHFFHAAFGGSFLNHQFLVAAEAPVYPNAPSSIQAKVDPVTGALALDNLGKLVLDSKITPIGAPSITSHLNGDNPVKTYDKNYAVNTTYSINLTPAGTTAALGSSVMPSINDSNPEAANYYENIGDRLSKRGVSWKWYSGGWKTMLKYSFSNPGHGSLDDFNTVNPTLQVQWHHQPFAYFDNYAPFDTGSTVDSSLTGGVSGVTRAENSAKHLQDETDFFSDVANDTLPAVTFIKPVGVNNEHPGYAALQTGQNHVASIIQAVQANRKLWKHTAIIITYDENGGRWDHVAPPSRDIWGPGVRVPAIIISPFARKGYVDHKNYDTLSILATIEDRFHLKPLNERDAHSPNLFRSFSALDIDRGCFSFDHRSHCFAQDVTIRNIGSKAVAGPVRLALDNLSEGTELTEANGIPVSSQPGASPSIVASSGDLAPGASATVTLRFKIPTKGGISYSARTFTPSEDQDDSED